MRARQTSTGLKMLVVGAILSSLVGASLHRRSTPKELAKNPTEGNEKSKSRKKRHTLTNNAVAAGIISAIVAGVISFLVAHYQTQESYRQATEQANVSQQASVAGQIETESSKLFYHSLDYNDEKTNCIQGDKDSCKRVEGASTVSLFSDMFPLQTTENNLSDKAAINLIEAIVNDVFLTVYTGDNDLNEIALQMQSSYESLLKRCGELIQETS